MVGSAHRREEGRALGDLHALRERRGAEGHGYAEGAKAESNPPPEAALSIDHLVLGLADLDITAACPRSEPLMTTIFADPRRADEGKPPETIAKRSARSRADAPSSARRARA
jgi:hypothetical protein